ncbi:MAG: RNA polymerase factor sigma-54, partial [Candidatus Accumulibacter sp.]|nr:RNA polymerase factor sigma-54 [Accumulibacter sp.]
MKPSLVLTTSQHLALTPQLQQSIRLLQLSTIELEQELEKYLLENPLLEREEEFSRAEAPDAGGNVDGVAEPVAADEQSEHAEQSFADEENWPSEDNSQYSSSGSFDDEESDYQDIQAANVSLRDHLLWQIGLMILSDR